MGLKFQFKLNIGVQTAFKHILYLEETINLFNFVHERWWKRTTFLVSLLTSFQITYLAKKKKDLLELSDAIAFIERI